MSVPVTLWLLWIVLQCSLVGFLAWLLLFPLSRALPETRARVALVGLAAMAALLALGLVPGEGWIGQTAEEAELAASPPAEAPGASQHEDPTLPLAVSSTDAAVHENSQDEALNVQWQRWTAWAVAAPASRPEEEVAPVTATSTRAPWLWWIGVTLLLVQTIAIVRIVGGFWAIRCLSRRAKPCSAKQLHERLADLKQKSGLSAPITLAQSDDLQTPAVVGWRSYTILLPPEYPTWSSDQCDAVLAHELAHIARRDSWWRIAATLLQAAHFYNPLAWLLTRRFFLEQELAADQLACHWLGTRETYLRSLATLALERPAATPAWPSLAFLPPRSMFVRRLEMLRHMPRASSRGWERLLFGGSLLAIVAVSVVIAGLRPLAAQPPVGPNGAAAPAVDTEDVWLGELVPNELAEMALEVDFAQLLQSQAVARMVTPPENPNPQQPTFSTLVQESLTLVPPTQVAQLFGTQIDRHGAMPQIAIFVRTAQPVTTKLGDAVQAEGVPVGQLQQRGHISILTISPNLFVHSSDRNILMRISQFLNQPADQRDSFAKHSEPTEAPLRLSLDWASMGPMLLKEPGFANSPNQLMIAPLTRPAQRWTLEIGTGGMPNTTNVLLTGTFGMAEEAVRAEETLASLKVLLQNLHRNAADALAEDDASQGERAAVLKPTLALTGQLLDSAEAQAFDTQVKVTASAGQSLDQLLSHFLPAIHASRMAAQRVQDVNHAKQIGIAFHNYHETYGHFPPPVVVDPKSGQKRSWRVEILPFLDYLHLYEQYRKDEPWDSEANQQVLAQMPAVYRSAVWPAATSTSFYVVTGKGTALAGDKPTYADFRDGMSNTVLLVQTKKDTPWTKPEDLTMDEAKPQNLGGLHPGGFVVGISDGSVRFVSKEIDANNWKNLLLRDDGNVIQPF